MITIAVATACSVLARSGGAAAQVQETTYTRTYRHKFVFQPLFSKKKCERKFRERKRISQLQNNYAAVTASHYNMPAQQLNPTATVAPAPSHQR